MTGLRLARAWGVYLARLVSGLAIHVFIVTLQTLGLVVGAVGLWLLDVVAALAGWPPARTLFARLSRYVSEQAHGASPLWAAPHPWSRS